jgi:hypothetical protein
MGSSGSRGLSLRVLTNASHEPSGAPRRLVVLALSGRGCIGETLDISAVGVHDVDVARAAGADVAQRRAGSGDLGAIRRPLGAIAVGDAWRPVGVGVGRGDVGYPGSVRIHRVDVGPLRFRVIATVDDLAVGSGSLGVRLFW